MEAWLLPIKTLDGGFSPQGFTGLGSARTSSLTSPIGAEGPSAIVPDSSGKPSISKIAVAEIMDAVVEANQFQDVAARGINSDELSEVSLTAKARLPAC